MVGAMSRLRQALPCCTGMNGASTGWTLIPATTLESFEMPTRPPTHRPPRCDAPSHSAPRARRPSASKRGYGRAWERLAGAFRNRHPYCADPFGLHDGSVPGSHVDHIVPRSADGTDEWSNLQTLCASCHSRKTARCDGGFGNPPRGG